MDELIVADVVQCVVKMIVHVDDNMILFVNVVEFDADRTDMMALVAKMGVFADCAMILVVDMLVVAVALCAGYSSDLESLIVPHKKHH